MDLPPGFHEPLRRRMFDSEFTYDVITLLQCNGYSFDPLPNPEVFHEKYYDINYWKAQLAFRGASSAGDDIVVLIERCINAELPDSMHPRVAVLGNRLAREYATLRWGPDAWSDDEEEDEWDEDWEDEEMDGEDNDGEEIFDEMDEDDEEGEYEDYDENDEEVEEDPAGYGNGNFQGLIDGGGNWNVVYGSYRL